MRIGSFVKAGLAAIGLAGGIALAQVPTLQAPPLAPKTVIAPEALVQPGGPHELTAQDFNNWVDGFMPYALKRADIAGAVVTLVKDGQIISARGYGYADVAKRTPVDPARTLFRPGSVSKLVTWTAVMQQVEAGKLDLDADVNQYLDFKIPPRNGKPITLRQIMTHTAGFEETLKGLISDKPVPDLGTYLKRWTPHRIFDAGTTPAYSNWATALAGYIVERVSGMPFDDYVEQRIFKPLDMQTASFRQPLPKALQPLSATGYVTASDPAKSFEYVGPAPAGSLSASGIDMAKFMIAHLEQGRGILKPETAAMMHDSPLDKVDPLSLMPPLNRMELGFFETNINGREVIAHLGDTEHFHTSLHLFLKEGVGIYFSFNSAGKQGGAHVVRTQMFENFADRYFPAPLPDGKVDAKTSAEHARMLAGNWESSRRPQSSWADILNLLGQTTVSATDKGELVIPAVTDASGTPERWVEIAPFVWRNQFGHDRIAAKVIDGKVVRWSFDLVAPFTVFDPVPAWRSASWLLPALYLSLGVLALTFLFWPIGWFTRRRYKAAMPLTGRALGAYRAVRIMAGIDVVILGGWIVLVSVMMSNLSLMNGGADFWLWLLQIAGAVAFFGAVGIAGWNAWLSWRDGRHWTGKLWNTLILLATLIVLYVALVYGLVSMTGQY